MTPTPPAEAASSASPSRDERIKRSVACVNCRNSKVSPNKSQELNTVVDKIGSMQVWGCAGTAVQSVCQAFVELCG